MNTGRRKGKTGGRQEEKKLVKSLAAVLIRTIAYNNTFDHYIAIYTINSAKIFLN